MQLDPHAIHIYTDGSCYRNPGGASGCAAIVYYPDHLQRQDEQILDFGCAESTNNRMELMACVCAVRWVRENRPWPGVSRVQVITDSSYVKDSVRRAREWRKNGWRNQYGEPKENTDLWKQLISAQDKAGILITFEWTPGKKTPALKRIDKAAKAAAQAGEADVDRGYRPGVVARSMVKGAAARFVAKGQTAVIRIYRKNLVAKGENKVRFDLRTDDLQSYVASCFAFCSAQIALDLHRQHVYRVRFNDNEQYPQVLELIEELELPRSGISP